MASTLVAMVLGACSGSDAGDAAAGAGGTVIRYAEPDYSNAAWERVWDAQALLSQSGADVNLRLRGFQHIAGLDDRNLWVIDGTGPLFGMQEGHWSYYGEVTDGAAAAALRAVSPGTVAVGRDSRRGGPSLVLVTPEGIRRFGDERGPAPNSAHIAVLAADFIDYYAAADLRGLSHRLLSGDLTPLRSEREREALLHRDDNTPIADYPVHAIMSTATFEPRVEAYAFWRNPRGRGGGATAEFRDGFWILRDEIAMDLSSVRASWFGRGDDDAVFLVAVGAGGFVLRQTLGGSALEQSLTGSLTTATSADLIAVWGQGPDDYYVMDTNGQIWQRRDNQWRSAVRGLYDEDILFNAAYVAPNGSIHAVTDTALYRLRPL